ncbi:MAG: MerR family transcriptional regulator [Gammaproteobacteria bacterium]|nr:MerR family transcriptional regulator [Gammaproteobacteria bacterium]
MTKDLIIIADYSQETTLSLEELCDSCHSDSDFIIELIKHDIIRSIENADERKFDLHQLERIKTVQRLQHDLDVNLEGVAVILDLLDELEELRSRLMLIEKHYL